MMVVSAVGCSADAFILASFSRNMRGNCFIDRRSGHGVPHRREPGPRHGRPPRRGDRPAAPTLDLLFSEVLKCLDMLSMGLADRSAREESNEATDQAHSSAAYVSAGIGVDWPAIQTQAPPRLTNTCEKRD